MPPFERAPAARLMSSPRPTGAFATALLAGRAGVGIGLLVAAPTRHRSAAPGAERPLSNAGGVFVNGVSPALFRAFGSAVYFSVRGARTGGRAVAADLLDHGPLYRHGHAGLRNAPLWTLGISLVVLAMAFDPDPLAGRETDLLARRAWIETPHDWPLDWSTLWWFAFYVVVPVTSRFFGTLLRRLLDTVLMDRLLGRLLHLVNRVTRVRRRNGRMARLLEGVQG